MAELTSRRPTDQPQPPTNMPLTSGGEATVGSGEDFPQRMRTSQAARYLGLSARTLEKWRLTGDGPPFVKLGRAVIYERQYLDDWVDAHRCASTSN